LTKLKEAGILSTPLLLLKQLLHHQQQLIPHDIYKEEQLVEYVASRWKEE
jgi:hypothetical protein